MPLANLGKELRPDYAIIKHCSDNEDGGLGINYDDYEKYHDLLKNAEKLSDDEKINRLKEINCECSEDIKREIYWIYNIIVASIIGGALLFALIGALVFYISFKR